MIQLGPTYLLFFDTETSGLFRKDLPLEDPQQPWCVTAAAELTDADGGTTGQFMHMRVRADGRLIKEGATSVHGVTSRSAAREGVSEVVVLGAVCGLAAQARYCIGHAIDFDRDIVVGCLMRRNKDTGMWKRPGLTFVDTMKAAAPFCRLPSEFGSDYGSFKWPSLDEACEILLGEKPREGRHDAWDDLQRTKRLYFKLRELGAFEVAA